MDLHPYNIDLIEVLMRKKRELSDEQLLSVAMRDVTPLPGRRIETTPKIELVNKKDTAKNVDFGNLPDKRSKTKKLQPNISLGDLTVLDKRTAQRMKRGKMKIDAELDLHGLYQDAAYRALKEFLSNAWNSKKRCLLVITGKGLHHGTSATHPRGVLQKMVPCWLNEEPSRSQILAFSYATRSDGGVGALYVLLKRQRSDVF